MMRSTSADAAQVIWAGGTGVWSTAGNWLGNAAPTSSDVAVFSGWAPLSRTAWAASALVTNGGDPVTNAIDGLTTGRWSTGANQAVGQWFKVDLGSAQSFDGLTLDAGTNTNDYPVGFDVYVSNDDVSYGSAVASGAGAAALVTLAFPAQTARYVKIMLNHTSAFWWSISELNIFASGGGTQLARQSWSGTASINDGTNVPANVLDNTSSSYWTTGAGQIAPQWFKVDMLTSQTFTRIDIDAAGDTNDYPRGYAIYAYNTDDGQHDGSAIAVGTGTSALVSVTFSARTARYIKIVQTAAFGAQWWSLHELNVLNGAATLSRTGWTASAGLNTGTAGNAIDGASGTRWTTGTGQAARQWFTVDLQTTRTFTALRLDDSTRNGEYPRSFAVYAYNTDDGLNDGNPIVVGTATTDVVDVSFSTQTARYLKVAITAATGNNWSIAELTVYGSPVASGISSTITIAGLVLSNAVTITQGAGVNITVTGSYAQTAGAFVGSSGTLALQGAVTVAGGTLTAGSGAVTVSGAATISGGGVFNGGTSTGLGFGNTLAIGNGTAGTFNAGSAAVTFTGVVTLQNGGVFNGNTGSGTFSAAPTLTSGVFTVADAGSNGRWTLTQSTTFSSGVTLAFPTSGGELSLSPTRVLTLNGPVTSNASSTLPKIDCNGCAAGQGIGIAFGSSATLNINGLELHNSVTTGVSIANGATYTLLERLKLLDNVGGAGSTHLAITLGTALVNVPGCYFDTSAATNVTLNGTAAAVRGARAIFELQSTAVNGAGAGESTDADGDSNDDGLGDVLTAPQYGSVVEWVAASPADTAGTSVGFPAPAFDWNTFTFYGEYAAYKNIAGASTADRVWLRHTDGSAGYSFDVADANGDIVGTPAWDAIDETAAGLDVNGDGDAADTDVRVVYVATSAGHIIKLIDTGSALSRPASGAWTSDFTSSSVASITSALIPSSTNLYFGGTDATAATKIFGVQVAVSTMTSPEKSLAKNIASLGIAAEPGWAVYNNKTYLFAGSLATTGTALVYRVEVSPGAVVESSFNAGANAVNGAINVINNRAYAVTSGGKLHVLDAASFGTGAFTNVTGFPYQTTAASPISSAPYVDFSSSVTYFGDNAGNLYAVTSAGANLAGYPYAVSGAPQLAATPCYVTSSGVIAAGAADGYVYFIDRHDGASTPQLFKRYFAGTGGVSSVAYDVSTSRYLVATSDGHLTYIDRASVPDPTSGTE